MPTYRVKPGHRFGVGKAKGPGDLVELTEAEAAGFLDKLEPCPELAEGPSSPGILGGLVEDEPEKAVTDESAGLVLAPAGAGEPAPAGAGAADASKTPPDGDEDETAPALDLPALWAAQAPGLQARVVEVMVKAQLAPAVVKGMTDEALLTLDGVGPTTMRAIREHLLGVA